MNAKVIGSCRNICLFYCGYPGHSEGEEQAEDGTGHLKGEEASYLYN